MFITDVVVVVDHEVKQTDSNGNHGNHNSLGFADDWTPEIPFENVCTFLTNNNMELLHETKLKR